ncbi:hypothetical protein PVAR5_5221 [Paecilomyces variotii No. 5]|uniref:Epoxide hydrolase N-terminal domain-containing protein n=1 Tax=Byssochlamys spectabilis (strain No. 5 / NBRC 109023) TaxID=1356009 RepID=V5FWW4_BYSSN|nr:hypothetical protein PVAR5_5221 [Paecilomyces variotii No. 5]
MSLPFSTPPSSAKLSPTPFKAAIPGEKLAELETLVKLSKLAPATYENSQPDGRYGITTEWLVSLRDKWLNSFDWKSTENRINTFPQFTTEIEGLTIHFVALFSEKKDAVPILLLHGWPGSFLEFLPMLQMFRDEFTPSTLPYHLIVPSLPGYTFSSGPPLDKNFATHDVARVMDKLMRDIGFESGYVVQGGDIGSRVARVIAVDYESCKGMFLMKISFPLSPSSDEPPAIHLNVCFMRRPNGVTDENLTAFEKDGIERLNHWLGTGTAYGFMHGTRPSTIGHVLSTSPVALLAWIGEKFLQWVDEPLPPEFIMESVTLYWLTETYARSIYTYREGFPPPPVPPANDPRWYIHKPYGHSYFPKELSPTPRSWVETTGNLVFWGQHSKGGHFAALEQPEALKKDLVTFVEQVWPEIAGVI